MAKFIRYDHHGVDVAVREDLKGLHRDHCLCYSCDRFKPEDRKKNCPIANELYELCCTKSLTTPVWECAAFKEHRADGQAKA